MQAGLVYCIESKNWVMTFVELKKEIIFQEVSKVAKRLETNILPNNIRTF